MGSARYNWEAAFMAFMAGSPLDEISLTLAIPEAELKKRANARKWSSLALQAASTTAALERPAEDAELNRKLKRLEENREVNYTHACRLRGVAENIIRSLEDGTARVEKSWHNKGLVTTHESKLSTGDLVNISTFLRTIQEMTYKSLGDVSAAHGTKSDPKGAEQMLPPPIIINLPGSIQAPRMDRPEAKVEGAGETTQEYAQAAEKALEAPKLPGGEYLRGGKDIVVELSGAEREKEKIVDIEAIEDTLPSDEKITKNS